MAALAATSLNGVRIYNLASGKTFPQWLSEKTKRSLAKDEEYRNRVELLQDFHFPSGTQRIKMSPDQNFVVATGMYPPSVKVYDVRDLSMKFERRLDAQVVQFEILSHDIGKLCFLQTDRTLTFHAAYGKHYSLRIPTFGRDMAYHRQHCDLYVAASGSEVYRVNLDQGQFLSPLSVASSGANVIELNPVHQLVGVGCEDGAVECWDSRIQKRVGRLDVFSSLSAKHFVSSNTTMDFRGQVTSLAYHDDGLKFAAGTTSGHCLLYDLRSAKPLLVKSHQYGLDILDVKFHNSGHKVISADSKVIKVWEAQDGAPFTTIETPAEIKSFCIAGKDHSGVILVAGEQERVMAYYVPDLGVAPKWCSFLDSLTEELEEQSQSTVYDDYHFVTRENIQKLGLGHLIGTPLLKAYMHGFFMDARLYNKVKAIAEPFAYETWRKQQIAAKMEAKQGNRISIQSKLPKVNRAAAERILNADAKRKSKQSAPATSNLLEDDRFSNMFANKDFEIDEENDTYKLLHPTTSKDKQNKRLQAADIDSDVQSDEGDSDGSVAPSSIEGKCSDDSTSEEDEMSEPEVLLETKSRQTKSQDKASLNKAGMKYSELGNLVGKQDLLAVGSRKDQQQRINKKRLAHLSLAERMQQQSDQVTSTFTRDTSRGGAYTREMKFFPSRSKQEQGKRGGKDSAGKDENGRKRRAAHPAKRGPYRRPVR
ncbi:unnamed protein product [Albugo candida]|uniref:Uncharacterized protein n=1 Tax=Albugo candida TaxID=65357 RepID=A0A024G7Q4_9STRA|nr:unnamed protein product [Albugo candida]|eukprot:CCI42709.1 unnamed protein product [Albugo candida]